MKLIKKVSVAVASAGFMVLAATAEAKAVSLTYDSQIGSPGFAPGELFVPQGVTVQDETGNVYVSNGRGLNPDGSFNPDLGNKVEIYNPSGEYIGAVGSGGTGPGEFDEPSALEFSPKNGNLYVGDVFNNRINVYDSKGNFLNTFGEGLFGGLIEGRAFFGPSGITFDEVGNVYIGDFSNDRILKFTEDGELLGSIGSAGTEPGQFQGPAGVRISPTTGNFFVTDQFNNRVQVLSPEGEALLVFGEQGIGDGQFNQPIGVEVDADENIYVADSINSRVQVFDREGNFLTAYGEPALNEEGQPVPPPQLGEPPFGDPLDLTPGRFNWTAGTSLNDGKLYVGDFFQGRVQVLDIERHKGATKVPEPASLLGLGVFVLGAAMTKFKKDKQQSA
ncbi:scytonemin biosynthesis PEP-CTERM protein ScyF [Calothrix sp. CCY 0018]|uniref:scytonemin biosynthesis PEP-CTERM protein ScyF n=1 Tax=Calothrix sp. CCY 0018 TaxID=3103864 RepID=UPI0039C75B25